MVGESLEEVGVDTQELTEETRQLANVFQNSAEDITQSLGELSKTSDATFDTFTTDVKEAEEGVSELSKTIEGETNTAVVSFDDVVEEATKSVESFDKKIEEADKGLKKVNKTIKDSDSAFVKFTKVVASSILKLTGAKTSLGAFGKALNATAGGGLNEFVRIMISQFIPGVDKAIEILGDGLIAVFDGLVDIIERRVLPAVGGLSNIGLEALSQSLQFVAAQTTSFVVPAMGNLATTIASAVIPGFSLFAPLAHGLSNSLPLLGHAVNALLPGAKVLGNAFGGLVPIFGAAASAINNQFEPATKLMQAAIGGVHIALRGLARYIITEVIKQAFVKLARVISKRVSKALDALGKSIKVNLTNAFKDSKAAIADFTKTSLVALGKGARQVAKIIGLTLYISLKDLALIMSTTLDKAIRDITNLVGKPFINAFMKVGEVIRDITAPAIEGLKLSLQTLGGVVNGVVAPVIQSLVDNFGALSPVVITAIQAMEGGEEILKAISERFDEAEDEVRGFTGAISNIQKAHLEFKAPAKSIEEQLEALDKRFGRTAEQVKAYRTEMERLNAVPRRQARVSPGQIGIDFDGGNRGRGQIDFFADLDRTIDQRFSSQASYFGKLRAEFENLARAQNITFQELETRLGKANIDRRRGIRRLSKAAVELSETYRNDLARSAQLVEEELRDVGRAAVDSARQLNILNATTESGQLGIDFEGGNLGRGEQIDFFSSLERLSQEEPYISRLRTEIEQLGKQTGRTFAEMNRVLGRSVTDSFRGIRRLTDETRDVSRGLKRLSKEGIEASRGLKRLSKDAIDASRGLKRLRTNIGFVGKGIRGLGKGMELLKSALPILSVGILTQRLVSMGRAAFDLNIQLSRIAESTGVSVSTTSRLLDAAQRQGLGAQDTFGPTRNHSRTNQ